MERMCSKMLRLSVFLLPCCHYKSERSFKRFLNPGIPTSDTREKRLNFSQWLMENGGHILLLSLHS